MSEQLLQDAQRAHQAGQLADAARLYREFLGAYPAYVPALYALGMVYFQQSQFDQAEYLFAESLKADPMFAEGMCMRGVTLVKLNRRDEALTSFEQALRVKPDFIEARCNHATTLLELGRVMDGLQDLDRALAIDPRHALSWNNRGNALFALKRYLEAVESYDRALAIFPEFPDARLNRLLAVGEINRGGPRFAEILLARGEELMRNGRWQDALTPIEEALAVRPAFPQAIAQHAIARREAARHLFDEYAPTFEQSLLGDLNYRGPTQLRSHAELVWPDAKSGMRILDLGCGTGLIGDAFKDWANGGRLDGIDLSARMIEQARKRGIYTDLVIGDLEPTLTQMDATYDLALAGDTIMYFSTLSAIFVGVAKHLRPGGLFIFTAEKKDGEAWEQTVTRRFRHSEIYLRNEAERAGFTVAALGKDTLRLEAGAPVAGFVVALQRTSQT